ncbi:Small nuclear ribonucleoprotein [Pyrenophora tritici-repentis]|uniref:Small nuclear ribonucleoprotein n=2 Tax=Pyrenophora tritici-repentis TaxID=45151 RepID=A0A2W1H3Q4_9PLEO|nr:Small nuclear ribonucleoprotein [Pyrenophora tritici-repentis]KAI0586617.1 Small nuclear ribonucleoprotein [Pyrenophora tritici-repentis]KAI0591564.1 Small nuclear ribonucleoprotein [Pyrenophora tritici-repentis]KAI0615530.1 Small nuclear ribonucleoprotein [Pyrenophora tritici-repentis]KAI0627905.1 Small nuclear ribonucleoprotein [Pyrenophora tritici-repentis]
MAFNQHPPRGPATAGGAPNMAPDFNAMLQRSMQAPGQLQAQVQEPPRGPSPSMGYEGVYSATPPPQHGPNVLGGARGMAPQPILPVDLPPQAFLTSAMLLDMVDKKVDVLLRDEKEYIGILRSYDQFANLVLTECYERIAARNPDAQPSSDPSIPRWLINDVKLPGVMTIRGENVTICATVDLDREEYPKGAKFAEEDQVRSLAASQKAEKKEVDSRKAKALKQAGIEPGFGMQG